MRIFLLALTAIVGVAGANPVTAQNYPVKPVRVVMPFPAGGGLDIVLRPLLQKMSENLQQNFVLDMRPGANGVIGTEIAAKSPPDGYTLLGSTMAMMVINPNVYSKLPFDVVRDLAPVARVGDASFVMVIHPSIPARNVREFVALAKRRPDELAYGSGGVGNITHLGPAYFSQLTGIRLLHVPYQGSTPLIAALMGGHVAMAFESVMQTVPRIRAGKFRAMGIAAAKRSPVAPEIPTIKEEGGPEITVSSWYGLLAPAGAPRDIVAKLHAEVVKALADPALRDRYAAIGLDPVSNPPDEFAVLIRDDLAHWGKVVRAAGARLD